MSPVVPALSELISYNLAIPLPRYAQMAEIPETMFFGIRVDADFEGECDLIWLKSERDMIARYLNEAQFEIENEVNYPLHPKWFADEEHPYAFPVISKWGKLIEVGIRVEANEALADAVNHATDPAVVGPTAVVATDPDEIRVYHPGTDIEIIPSSIEIDGAGDVTIEIPRARLVTEAASNNTRQGIDYADTGIGGSFEQTVDIRRVYTSNAVNAVLKWPHACSVGVCCTCGDFQSDACMYIQNKSVGIITTLPATYSAGAWGAASVCCRGNPSIMEINYKAGLNPIHAQAEDAIFRLAHAKMPHEPCGCEYVKKIWTRDRNVPKLLTRERINCPFGMSDGAWTAWRFSQAIRQIGMGLI